MIIVGIEVYFFALLYNTQWENLSFATNLEMSKQYSELLYRGPYTGQGGQLETPKFSIRVLNDDFKLWKKGKLIVQDSSVSSSNQHK